MVPILHLTLPLVESMTGVLCLLKFEGNSSSVRKIKEIPSKENLGGLGRCVVFEVPFEYLLSPIKSRLGFSADKSMTIVIIIYELTNSTGG
jgi:hypothetical protein